MTMTAETLSKNLRRIRVRKELGQVELAARAGLSRAAYQKIEKGVAIPRVDTLQRIVEALDVNFSEVIKPHGTLRHVRFRASKKLKTREEILVRVEGWLQHYNEIENLLNDIPGDKITGILGRATKSKVDPSMPEEAAYLTRNAFELAEKEPVWDTCGLLETSGIKVRSLVVDSNDFFGLAVSKDGGGPAIAVNVLPRLPVERWIFSAIHELGHLVMHQEAFDVDQSLENPNEESEANEFASYFLMPRRSFEERLDKSRGLGLVDGVFKIKRFFGVSYKTVIRRLIDLKKVHAASIYKDFNLAYRRQYHKKLQFTEEPSPVNGEAFQLGSGKDARSVEPQGLEPSDFMGERYKMLIRRGIEEELVSLVWAAEALETDLASIKEWTASWKYVDDQ